MAPTTPRRERGPMSTTHRAKSKPPPRKSGGRASHRRERGGTTKPALGAPARRRRQRRRELRATATALREEATAPTTTPRECEPLGTTHRAEIEPPPQKSGGRASYRDERGGMTKPALGAPARHCRQRWRERRATATTPREEATAPTTTRRERELLGTTHRAKRASRRHGRAATERHAAASVAELRNGRQERQRCAVGSGPVSATAINPREEATAPRAIRRERAPRWSHRAEPAGRRFWRVLSVACARAAARSGGQRGLHTRHGAVRELHANALLRPA